MYLQTKTNLAIMKYGVYHCNECGEDAKPRRDISVLNLGFYIIVGLVVGFTFSALLGIFLTVISTTVNMKIIKPQCPDCHSLNVSFLTMNLPKSKKDISEDTSEDISKTQIEDIEDVDNSNDTK